MLDKKNVQWIPAYVIHVSRRNRICSDCGKTIPREKPHYLAYHQLNADHFHSIPICFNCAQKGVGWRQTGAVRTFTRLKLENGLEAKLLYLGDPTLSPIANACKKDIRAGNMTVRGVTSSPT